MPPSSESDAPELANGGSPNYIRTMDKRLIVLETRFDTILPTLATKTDLVGLKAELREEMGTLRTDMRAMNGELRTEMRAMHGELKADMERMRADMQRWMIVTLVSLFTGFGGLLLTTATRWPSG